MDVTISISEGWLAAFGLAALGALVLSVWTIIDVARRPRWQLSVGQKVLWITGMVIGWFLVWPVAALSALFYLFAVRKRLNAIAIPGLSQATWDTYANASSARAPELAPAGWYDDPGGGGGQRWWDGRGWSEHLRERP